MNKVEMNNAQIWVFNIDSFLLKPPTRLIAPTYNLVKYVTEKKNSFCRCYLDVPFVPRTTGPKSQNNAIWGYADQINNYNGQGKRDIVEIAKSRAVDKGLCRQKRNEAGELMVNVWGYPVGISLTQASASEAFAIIQELVDIAKELNITLKECEK